MRSHAARRTSSSWLIFLWLAIAIVATTTLQFDWTQDIRAYADNIQRHYLFGEAVTDRSKHLWYEYLLFPLWELLGDIDLTLFVVKATIMALFFFSQRRYLRSQMDAAIFIGLIILTPILSENVVEYLRQGMAIGTFLLALSFTRPAIRWALIAVAVLQHAAVLVLLVAMLGGGALAGRALQRTQGLSRYALYFTIAGITTAITIFGFLGAPIVRTLPFADSLGFLGGSRANPLAAAFLLFYTSFVGYQAVVHRSAAHFSAFMGLLIVAGTYSAILDFGRALSIVMPLHLHASLTLNRKQNRYVDQIALFLAGTAVILA